MAPQFPFQIARLTRDPEAGADNDVAINSNCRAALALQRFRQSLLPSWSFLRSRSSVDRSTIPLTSAERCADSLSDKPIDLAAEPDTFAGRSSETILYLAYGSNLSDEAFRGKRGIRPISAINVAVPTLKMTFDLPGLPYSEPCFANTAKRDPSSSNTTSVTLPPFSTTEKTPLLPSTSISSEPPDYHKDHWHKPLIGVVYEVTPTDFAHIIATEGGGSSYRDILVPCHPLPPSTPSSPSHPTTPPLLAHTLFAPATPPPPPGQPPPKRGEGGRIQRPDPAYAQPSARYLRLITDGAAERALPDDYRAYLAQIRPYTPTSPAQRLGQYVFLSVWAPLLVFVFSALALFGDRRGRSPPWLVQLTGAIFVAVWASYDNFFRPTFGDGERSLEDGGVEAREREEVVRGKVEGWERMEVVRARIGEEMNEKRGDALM